MKPLLVIGSSGHAGPVLESIELQSEYQVIGLLDSFEPVGTKKRGYEVCGAPEEAAKISTAFRCPTFFIAVGDNWSRWRIARRLAATVPALTYPVVLHPSALVSRSARIGPGAVILAGAIISTNAAIGEGCIVNVASSINHDCRLDEYSSISAGVHVGGGTIIGARSSAGISSTLREKITIGNDTVIGAGAVVLDDVPAQVVVCGIPAKVIRERQQDEAYLR